MQQVKLFKGREDELATLEHQVNLWIAEHQAKVINIVGNIAPQSPSSHPNSRPDPSDILLLVMHDTDDVPHPAPEIDIPEHVPFAT